MEKFNVEDAQNQELISKHENIANLAATLKRKATARGFVIDNDTAVDEVMDAISALNERRRFVPTETELYEDKYTGLILRMAICAISKYGAEGQTSHSENGIGRDYDGGSTYPKSMMQEIVPLARGVGE